MHDAPAPAFTEHGNPDPDWLLVARWDAARKCFTLSWTLDGTMHRRSQQGAAAYPSDDYATFVEAIQVRLDALSTRRLF